MPLPGLQVPSRELYHTFFLLSTVGRLWLCACVRGAYREPRHSERLRAARHPLVIRITTGSTLLQGLSSPVPHLFHTHNVPDASASDMLMEDTELGLGVLLKVSSHLVSVFCPISTFTGNKQGR